MGARLLDSASAMTSPWGSARSWSRRPAGGKAQGASEPGRLSGAPSLPDSSFLVSHSPRRALARAFGTETLYTQDQAICWRAPMLDLLIVGGGINGCAIARDAAGRGLS